MKKRKLKKKVKIIFCIFIFIIIGIFLFKNLFDKEIITYSFESLNYDEIKEICDKDELLCNFEYEYNDEILENELISFEDFNFVISKGKEPINYDKLKEDKIDELGEIPVMMYHHIENVNNKYTGGNIDIDGYNRTSKAFREDLEFYYKSGYRMIRLTDMIDQNINTEYGYSPIVLTFDDGNSDNIKVTGRDESGNIIIDPNSAVGILEEFKHKYPDFNVTATFFVLSDVFGQDEYTEDIVKFLIDNGYDIGNHTLNHINIGQSNSDKVKKEIGGLYNILDKYTDKYVNILALPYGARDVNNYGIVKKGTYKEKEYYNKGIMAVGWKPSESPFDKNFNQYYIKRCRAYDNNGMEFDIKMVFNNLKYNKFISDGKIDKITIPKSKENKLVKTEKEIITY